MSDNEAKIIKISPNAIEITFPYVTEYIEEGLDRANGERSLEQVYAQLLAGQLALWIAIGYASKKDKKESIMGAMITQLIQYPNTRVLALPYIGSKPHTIHKWFGPAWGDDSPILEYAKATGCSRIEGYARDGWLKYIEPIGFKKAYITVQKEI